MFYIFLCVITIASCITAVSCFYKEHRMKRDISELTGYLMKVQDNLELPKLEKMKEGELSILQSEIYKVVALLQQSYHAEVQKKTYMADMLSDISHQIKTPLTAISVMTDLLEAPHVEEEKRREYVSKIDRQTKKITCLIKNLLTLSRLDADVIEFREQEILLHDIVEHITDTFAIMAEVKNIMLVTRVSEEIRLAGDIFWLTEAIANIVKNCIEHTEPGGRIRITAKQDNIAVHMHIQDNGDGIAPEHLPHIFERFYKSGNASKDSVGIGLAMAKQIILKQNGVISVTSTPGQGSDFYIKLYRKA